MLPETAPDLCWGPFWYPRRQNGSHFPLMESGWWLGPTVSVAHSDDEGRYLEVFTEFLLLLHPRRAALVRSKLSFALEWPAFAPAS